MTCALAQRETAELMNVQPPDSHQLFVSPVLDVRLTQIFRSKAVEMKLMIDGIWRGDVALTVSGKSHPIETGSFRGRVTVDGSSDFVAEPGRYHLYASYACPFAYRVILGRVLKRLQNVVGLSVLHPTWNTLDGMGFRRDPTLDQRWRGRELHAPAPSLYRITAKRYGQGHRAGSIRQPDAANRVE